MNRLFYRALVAFGQLPLYAASARMIAGRDHFRGVKGVLLVANHPHYFDSMLIMGSCPRPVRWLSMVEVSRGNLFGAPLAASEHLAADVRAALVSLYQTAAAHVKEGSSSAL